jgi:TolB protein
MSQIDKTPRRMRVLGVAACLLLLGAVGCAPVASAISGSVPPARVASAADSAAPAPNVASLGVGSAPVRQAAENPPGKILFVREGNLWLWQGGNARQFSDGSTWSQPAFSPDGTEIAYVYWTFNFSDLFVMAADGSQSRRLTRGQSPSLPDNSWAFRPAWSSDGARLAYISDANSALPQIWVIGKDGNNRRQVTSELVGIQWADSLTWDPKGARLAATAAPDMREPSQIYLIDVATGAPERLTRHQNGALDPAWSPDGSALAYIGRPGGQTELWVRNIEGTKEAHLDKLAYVRSPAWSPDGKMLAVLAVKDGAFEIWVLDVKSTQDGFELGEPRQLTRDAVVDPMAGLTWAP